MRKIAEHLFRLLNTYSPAGLILWLVVLSLLYSLLSVLRHHHFQSGAFDLGIFDQAVWQYSQFQFPYNTIKERFILGDHLTLTLPLLSPLFYIWNDVKILLIFQAVWITLSSLAVYKIGRLRHFSSFTSLVLTLLYSLFFGIQYGVFFDFHSIIIGVGFLPWIAYFLEKRSYRLLWGSVLLALLTQENMGIGLAGLGCIYLFEKQHRRYALGFIFGGLAASFLSTKIISLLSPVGYEYFRSIPTSPFNILYGFFDTQERRDVWLYSLSWFSFLPLFSPGAMLAVFMDLSQYYVLGRSFSWMQGPFLHHRAILGVFLTLGTMQTLGFFQKKRIRLEVVCILLLFIAASLQFYFHFPLNKLSKPIYWQEEQWMKDNREIFAFIPKDARLATQQSLVPHLSHRQEIYLVWPREKRDTKLCEAVSCWWLDFSGKPEYLLIDLHPHQWVTQLLESNENVNQALEKMENAGRITLKKKIGEARLYRVLYN